jgi:heme/copper-type cytochrome/quinol oxidase subunit 2
MSTVPPPAPPAQPEQGLTPEQRRWAITGLVGLVLFIVVLMGVAVYFMVRNPESTTVIRDIFIIFMALESLVIGVALVILMIQLALLTNLIQHEIKPILENTNETVNTVRGTAIFVSENIVDPVMKLNGYIAALSKFFELFNVITKK